jgi:hypothetical protein
MNALARQLQVKTFVSPAPAQIVIAVYQRTRENGGALLASRPKTQFVIAGAAALFAIATPLSRAQEPSTSNNASPNSAVVLRFALSGDSRNCGDVVMPAIAAKVREEHPAFYWHLGDFRAIYTFDEDMQHEPEHRAKPMTISEYESIAWRDFLENQIEPFGAIPVFLGIGNHETIPPKTREELYPQIADWLDSPILREQRLRDDPHDHRLRTYYHWMMAGADFINLDNATADQFDSAQMKWFEGVLSRDKANPEVKTIIVGMHEALPDSISASHSMNESPVGAETGRQVYQQLLRAQNEAHKRVYVFASHSHYYMENIFNTEAWRKNGGVLPGWIVGTGGAVRYALPEERSGARAAMTNVYGYLRISLHADGALDSEFRKLDEKDVPAAVSTRFTPEFVHWCFAENSNASPSADAH